MIAYLDLAAVVFFSFSLSLLALLLFCQGFIAADKKMFEGDLVSKLKKRFGGDL